MSRCATSRPRSGSPGRSCSRSSRWSCSRSCSGSSPLPLQRRPLSHLHVLGVAALDVLRVVGGAIERERGHESNDGHEGLLPARAVAARRRQRADRRLPLRLDRPLRDDGLVPGVADLGDRARSRVSLHGDGDSPRRRPVPLGRRRAVPRRPVHDPVHPPALALRLRGRVRDHRAPEIGGNGSSR